MVIANRVSFILLSSVRRGGGGMGGGSVIGVIANTVSFKPASCLQLGDPVSIQARRKTASPSCYLVLTALTTVYTS